MVEILFCVACSLEPRYTFFYHFNVQQRWCAQRFTFSRNLLNKYMHIRTPHSKAQHRTHSLTHDTCFLIWYGRWISDNFIYRATGDGEKKTYNVLSFSSSAPVPPPPTTTNNGRTLFTIYKCVILFTVRWIVFFFFLFGFKSRDEYSLLE